MGGRKGRSEAANLFQAEASRLEAPLELQNQFLCSCPPLHCNRGSPVHWASRGAEGGIPQRSPVFRKHSGQEEGGLALLPPYIHLSLV